MDVGLVLSDIADLANTTLIGLGPLFMIIVGLWAVGGIVRAILGSGGEGGQDGEELPF